MQVSINADDILLVVITFGFSLLAFAIMYGYVLLKKPVVRNVDSEKMR